MRPQQLAEMCQLIDGGTIRQDAGLLPELLEKGDRQRSWGSKGSGR